MTSPSYPRVAVLMSTYQGEAFVAQQIQSILVQLPPDGRLLVRDDGSTDRTQDVVRAIADARIELESGDNLGFARSFFALLDRVGDDVDVVLLADQDDIWLEGKIQRACEALRESPATPALYFSRLQLVDATLAPLGETAHWPRGPSFHNALCENIATGCTIALNAAALRLVRQTGQAGRIYFHDWWIYLVVTAFGRVVADDNTWVLYRQHGRNVVGRGPGLARYLSNLAFLRRRSWVHILYEQLENFRQVHGGRLTPAQRQELERFFDPGSVASVLRLLLWPRRRRQSLLDEFFLRGLLLLELVRSRRLLPRPPGT